MAPLWMLCTAMAITCAQLCRTASSSGDCSLVGRSSRVRAGVAPLAAWTGSPS